MQNPIDNQGRKWSLIKISDKVGRQTIQAYRNHWIPGKGSRVAQRISVGRLNNDGSIKVVSGFLAQFPEFEGIDLYWGHNELLNKKEFDEQCVNREEIPDISWSEPVIHYGLTWTATQIADQLGILEDLQAVYGKKQARDLLNLAIYKLDQAGSTSLYEDWLTYNWLPESQPIDSRRISDLLAEITDDNMGQYFALRHQRAMKRAKEHKLGMTLSFDSTSISTYSETIQETAFGKAKQDPELKQINLNLLCDHATGDVLFVGIDEGSVNDKAALPFALSRMQVAGYNLEETILVTDRGYQSIYNTALELKLELKFIQGITTVEDCVKAAFKRRSRQLNDLIAFSDPDMEMNAFTEKETWANDTPAGRVTEKIDLHLYRNLERAVKEARRLKKNAMELVEMLNQGKSVNPDFFRANKRYVLEHRGQYALNINALSEAVELSGCFAIRSNCGLDAFEVLRIYRERNIIEQNFNQLSTYKGKILVFVIAESLRMVMLNRIQKAVKSKAPKQSKDVKDNQLADFLKLPYESLPKLLAGLKGLVALKHCSTNAFTLKAMAKWQKRSAIRSRFLGFRYLPKYSIDLGARHFGKSGLNAIPPFKIKTEN